MTCCRPLAIAVCVLLFALPASALASDPGPYVALGDSFTAGTLIPNQVGRPAGCSRSDHSYPTLVAAAIGAPQVRDRSCTGATTAHMTAPQAVTLGSNPPQFDGLGADAGLVTIGIGANDVDYFGAAGRCIDLGLAAPSGTACRAHFSEPGGGDALAVRIAVTGPKIAATLQAIHARSPQARVLLVGYPAVFPRDGRGCYPLVPLSGDDIDYLERTLRAMNAMLAEQAAANDAEFADTYEDSSNHDFCEAIGTRWFEGLVPTAPAFPLHPNALGEASMARSVLRVLDRPRPGPVLGALTRSRTTITPGRALRISYTINRSASVTIAVQRHIDRERYSDSRSVATVDAKPGANTVALPTRQLGRRAGLYRVTASLADGSAQQTQFRIRRARRRQ